MTTLVPRDAGAAADLALFATRVARYEAEAVIRVVADGTVAAFFAETPFDALVVRALALAEPVTLDEVLEAGTLAARAVGERAEVELPPPVPALRWTSSLPPRSGWTELARLSGSDVRARIEAGIEEFRRRAPELTEGSSRREGRTVLENLADEIWDRELAGGVPLRLAHAAESYGFLGEGDVVLRGTGPWWRLDGPYGSVIARSGLSLFALR